MGNALPCFRPPGSEEGLHQAPQAPSDGPGAKNAQAGTRTPVGKASADGSAEVVTAAVGGPLPAKATGAGSTASPVPGASPAHDATKATPADAPTAAVTDAAVPGASANAPSDPTEAAPHAEPDAPALMDTLLSTFASTDGFPYQPYDNGPCTTEDEQSRLQALRAINVLGNVTNPGGQSAKLDAEVDTLLSTVKQLFQTETAMLALFEGGHVRLRNALGIQAGVFPWRWSFCGYTLSKHTPQSLVVHDALTDGRFCDNAFVTGAPFVRFYCGAPLVSSGGHILGTLCVTDSQPRPEFDCGATRLMNNLAELMVRQLERHKLGTAAAQADGETTALARVARTLDCYEAPIGLVDVAVQSGWVLMYANEAWEAAVQRPREQLVGRPLQSMFSAGRGGAAVAEQAGGQQGEEQQVPPGGHGQGAESAGGDDDANGGAIGTEEAAAGSVAGATAAVGNGSGGRLSGGGTGSGAEWELWVTVQRAVLAGEAVDVGRVRALGESGRRRGPPFLMQIRPANSHVLDAATRMPVGVPPELERQAELVRQSQAGAIPPTATAPDGDIPAEAAGAAVQSGALETANGLALTTGAAGAREPCYCFVLLAPLPPEQQLLEEVEEEDEEEVEEDEFGKTAEWCVEGGDLEVRNQPSATGAGPLLVEEFPAEAVGNSASLPGPMLSLPEPTRSSSGPFAAAQRPASATDGTPSSHLHERISKHLPPAAASEHSSGTNGRAGAYDSPMTVAGNAVAAALQGMHSGGYAAAGSGSGAGPRALAAHSPPHSSRGGGLRSSKTRLATLSQTHTSSHTVATPRGTSLHGSGRGPAARAGGGGAMPAGADWAYGMEPLPGLRLGHMLGKGGYGRVWEAQYKGRRVAAKVVSNSMLRAVSVVNGVSLEVLMAQELHHPHVVRTYKCVVRSFDNAAGLTPFALPSLGAGTASTSGATMVGRSREPSMALPGAGSGPAPSVRGRLPSGSPLHSPPPPPLPAAPPAAAGQPAPVSTEAAASWPQQQQQRLSAGGAAARSGSQEGGQASDGRAGSGGGPVARPPGGGGAARLDGSAGRVGPRQFSANWQDGEGPMDSFEAEASAAGWNMIDDLAEDPLGRPQPAQPSQQQQHAPNQPSAPPPPSSPSPEPTFTATTQFQALADTLSGPPSDASLEPPTPFATSLYPHRPPSAGTARAAAGAFLEAAPSIDLSPPSQRPSAAAAPSTTTAASASHPAVPSSLAITNSQPSNATSSAANNNVASNTANNNSSATHRLSVSSTSAAALHPFRIGDGGNYSVVGASMQHHPHPSGASTTAARTTASGMASSVLPADGRLPTSGQTHNQRSSAETGSERASGETGTAASGGGAGVTWGGGAAGAGSVHMTGASVSSCMGPVVPEGETWILQEFCSRGTLQDAVDRGLLRTDISRVRGLPCLPVILITSLEIASAMAYLHASGYIHGDLSAVNVLLTDSTDSTPEGGGAAPTSSAGGAPSTAPAGTAGGGAMLQRLQRGWVAKVSDFGLAKHVPGGPNAMHISSTFGVITHTAPETLKSYIQTQASDVYSFGVLMWQMWTSSRPWANMNRFQIMSAVTNPSGPGLRFTPAQTPPKRYHRLAMRCLSYEPSARPTFAEAVAELQDMLDNLPDMEEAAAAPGRGMGAGTAPAAGGGKPAGPAAV